MGGIHGRSATLDGQVFERRQLQRGTGCRRQPPAQDLVCPGDRLAEGGSLMVRPGLSSRRRAAVVVVDKYCVRHYSSCEHICTPASTVVPSVAVAAVTTSTLQAAD